MQRAERGDLPPAFPVAADDLAFEFMLNALRLPEGFREAEFTARTGLAFAAVAPAVAEARRLGLLEPTPGAGWRPTARGLAFLNELQALFLPAGTPAPASAGARL
jgi:oxygen-independent coproporphyrinogen-3 oxidase